MIYCINPECKQRQNHAQMESCQFCGTPLLINGQFHLLEPLRPLETDSHTEVFEVVDEKATWSSEPGTHKVMKVLKSNNPKLIELMEREANVLQLVDTPGIPLVDIDGYFTFQPNADAPLLHCLVLEKIPGINLETWLQTYGKVSQVLAINWLKQIAKILNSLHFLGFFHRDIKPTNIIIKPDGNLVLIDFGAVREVTNTYMAKLSRGLGSTTEEGGFYNVTVIRTACYTPLEQLNGKAVPQSDFYALGRTFVYLLTGIPLLDLPNDSDTGKLIWRNKAPHIDKPFADLLDEMMAPFPGRRPQNTQVILQRLERIPFQSKLNKVIKSNKFRTGLVGLFFLIAWGIYRISLPGIANHLVNQGKKAQLENRPSVAQEKFQLAIKINPEVTVSISSFYFEQASRNHNHPEIAKKYYELAINFNPNDLDAYNNLAVVCQKINNFTCVTNSYEKAFDLKPNNWEGYYGLGNFYDEQGKYDLAEKQYQLAIDTGGNQAVDAINNLSRLKNRTGQYTAAVELALKGLIKAKAAKARSALYKNLGWARLEQKRYLEAKDYLQKSLKLDPQRVDAYCLLAQAQEALDKKNNAKLSWEICLLASSSLPEVTEWREQVLQRILRK